MEREEFYRKEHSYYIRYWGDLGGMKIELRGDSEHFDKILLEDIIFEKCPVADVRLPNHQSVEEFVQTMKSHLNSCHECLEKVDVKYK